MGLFSGLKKIFRPITKSSLGRGLLIAAGTFVAGSALGLWPSPYEAVKSLFSSGDAAAGGMAASNVADAARDASPAFTEAARSSSESTAAQLLQAPRTPDIPQFGQGATQSVAHNALAGPAQVSERTRGALDFYLSPRTGSQDVIADLEASSQAPLGMLPHSVMQPAVQAEKKSSLSRYLNGDFAKLAAIHLGGTMLTAAMQPSPERIAAAQYNARLNYERQRVADRQANYDVGKLRLGMRPRGVINGSIVG